MSRSAASSPQTVIGCAPEDAPAVRGLTQRLRIDGCAPLLLADAPPEQRDQPRALRDTVRASSAALICLSRRAWGADGKLVPALANLLELLTLTPGRRLLIALKLTRCELPPELAGAELVELFGYSGYERLLKLLRDQADQARAVAAPTPVPAPPVPTTPVLALRSRMALPTLERQNQLRRIGRGVARAIHLLDQRQVLVVAGGGAALLDTRDAAPIWTIDAPARCAALSPGGRLLALAGGAQIQLWDLAEGRLRATCSGHSGLITGLAFTPDERTLVSVGHDGTLRLWRAGGEGGQPGAPLAALPAHSDQVTAVAVSPDGTLIASGGADRSVRIWRTIDRAPIQTLPGHGGAVEALAFSPDGALLAAGSRGRSARLWRTRSWQSLHTLAAHGGAVEALAFSPDGATLATGAADHAVRLWRVSDGGLAHLLSGHSSPIAGVSFSPDGSLVASVAADERLLSWQTTDGQPVAALRPLSSRVTALSFSPDGALLAVGATDGATSVYSTANEAPPLLRHSEHRGPISSLAFAPQQRLISTAADRTVRVCQLDSGQIGILLQTHGVLQASALAPGGRLLASSDGETTVQLWRLAAAAEQPTGQFWRVLRGIRSRARLVVFAPDGDALAVASDDGAVLVWRLADLEAEHDAPSLRSQSEVGRIRALAFSADGNQLAGGGDKGASQLWRLSDGASAQLAGQGAPICGLAFSPDGRALATGDTLGQIALWRLSGDDRRRRNAGPATTIAGHAGAVELLAFSPTGGLLASGSADGTVRLWRV